MSVSAQDIYDFGAPLADASSEVEWRACAVKVYYAAFHKCQEFADLCPDPNSNLHMGTHERLSKRFVAHPNLRAKAVGYVLEAMKKHRHIADYEIADQFNQSDAFHQRAQFPLLEGKLNMFRNEVTPVVSS